MSDPQQQAWHLDKRVPISPKWRGGWQWFFAQAPIPANATTCTVRLYGRFSGTGALTVRYGAAVLSAGNEPRIA